MAANSMPSVQRLRSRPSLRSYPGGLAAAFCLIAGVAPQARPQTAATADMGAMQMGPGDMTGMDMSAMNDSDDTVMTPPMDGPMTGAFGPYAMTREASGTSWQPESSPHEGLHFMAEDWMLMAHGAVDGVYDRQGGPRGAAKAFSAGMGMLMAQRPLGDGGVFGLRAMLSLDPLMGANGYPLLFATGETADGRTALVDRQHPHDVFMELSASASFKLSADSAVFLYAGLPGEPALGPPAFMHRLSGMDNPEAPITHHWLDSTHITYGVVTAGFDQGPWKVEASVFRGREPDQHRDDIEGPRLDSVSARISYNPAPDWSLQTSWGYLKSPEQLTPAVNENRLTASATYNRAFGGNDWATTFAWGRKMDVPGRDLDGFLLETELVLHGVDTVFGRVERVDEDELFDSLPALRGRVFTVDKLSLGYIHDWRIAHHLKLGIGGLVSRYGLPGALDRIYGDPTSFMAFMRLKLD